MVSRGMSRELTEAPLEGGDISIAIQDEPVPNTMSKSIGERDVNLRHITQGVLRTCGHDGYRAAYKLLEPITCYSWDVVSDVLLAVSYFQGGKTAWGWYTLFVVLGAAWVIGYLEIKETLTKLLRHSQLPSIRESLKMLLALAGLAQVFGHLDELQRNTDPEVKLEGDKLKSSDSSEVRLSKVRLYGLLEVFLESIPQLCLQFYIMMLQVIAQEVDTTSSQFYLQLLSMAGSLASFASTTAKTFGNPNMSSMGRGLVTSSLTCSTITRCACLVAAAMTGPRWMLSCTAAAAASYCILQTLSDNSLGVPQTSRRRLSTAIWTAPLILGLAPLSRSDFVWTEISRFLLSLVINALLLFPVMLSPHAVLRTVVIAALSMSILGCLLKLYCLRFYHPRKDLLEWKAPVLPNMYTEVFNFQANMPLL